MKKIKIIDLLNKIANGEKIPKEIEYTRKHYYLTNNQDIDNFGSEIGMFNLNDEIEVIEDAPKEEIKIPEKLDLGNATVNEQQIEFKINEIIDYLESKGEK